MNTIKVACEVSAPPASKRFTLDGSKELETRLGQICENVLASVLALVSSERLEALLLGGGYGRGEGGVLHTSAGDKPYNDLEFYVCLRGAHWLNERRYGAALHSLGETLSASAGLEVEFKILPLQKLRRSPVSMFYYDLVMGHRWLWGTEILLAECDHHRVAEDIPLAEATRLLMNRCSGLLFARDQLDRERFTLENADFIGRNLAKAQLAFGDVLLTVHGRYHWSCRVRAQRLEILAGKALPAEAGLPVRRVPEFPRLAEVQRHHSAGVEFKLHPERTAASRKALKKRHQEVCALALELWLWLERYRLNHSFANLREYVLHPLDKCPETEAWRNCLVNLKAFGHASLFHAEAHRHPRERILDGLAALLWLPEVVTDQELLRQIQSTLGASAHTFPDLVAAYHSLWRRFN